MSGVPMQSTPGDTGMCVKPVTAFYCCQRWRLSSIQKSQLAHCGCLIFNTTKWLLFPRPLTIFELRFAKKSGRYLDIWQERFHHFKGNVWCTWDQCWSYDPQKFLTRAWLQCNTIFCRASGPDCCWDSGFLDPISNRRKWVKFVVPELWEQNKQNAN